MRELKGDWRDLLNGFMIALDLRKMFLGLCGIVLTIVLCGGVTILVGNELAPEYVKVPGDLVLHRWWSAQCHAWHVIYTGVEYVHKQQGVVCAPVCHGGDPLVAISYSAVFVLFFIVIWSYFGGAISRIAACEIAKDGERIETRKALDFAKKKFWSFFWAPLVCVIAFFFFAFCNFSGGLIGKVLDLVGIGAPLVMLFLPLALLSGFIMTLIAVGTLAGSPLFAPAVAAEGTDSFDAVSRGFSYVYSRPWHYIGYQILTWLYGCLCIGFVILFAVALCYFGVAAGAAGFELCGLWDAGEFTKISNTSWSIILSSEHASMNVYDSWCPRGLVTAPHPYGRLQVLANQIVGVNYAAPFADLGVMHRVAAVIMTFWLVITLGLALGYVVSYFFSQQCMIYGLLRKKVDGIEMQEVFEDLEEEAGATEQPAKAEAHPAAPPSGESQPPASGEAKK